MNRLTPRALREEMWLASIPADALLEDELRVPLARCRRTYLGSTLAWLIGYGFGLAADALGTSTWQEGGVTPGVILEVIAVLALAWICLGSILELSEFASWRLTLWAAWAAFADKLGAESRPGGGGVRLLHFAGLWGFMVAPFGFALCAIFVRGIGSFQLFAGLAVAIPFGTALCTSMWDTSRERAVEAFYRFE